MSITGTGAENDPYLVTTYTELVSKAAESGKFTKLANNIDIYDEFPLGNPTQLIISGTVDGDNRTINHMTRTDSTIAIDIARGGVLKNTNFKNIMTAISFMQTRVPSQDFNVIHDCSFAGRIEDGFVITRNGDNHLGKVSRCAFDVEGNMLRLFADYTTTSKENLYVRLKTNDSYLTEGNANSRNYTFANCYFDITAPNLTNFLNTTTALLVNCALDIKTSSTLTLGTGSTGATSIVNAADGPLITAAGNVVSIAGDKWLDAQFLYDAGFDIIVPQQGE